MSYHKPTFCRWVDGAAWKKIWKYFMSKLPRIRYMPNLTAQSTQAERESMPWVVVFMDNLRCHINDEEMLREGLAQHVEFITFLPHTTDFLQPLDSYCNSAMKTYMADELDGTNEVDAALGVPTSLASIVRDAQAAIYKAMNTHNIMRSTCG